MPGTSCQAAVLRSAVSLQLEDQFRLAASEENICSLCPSKLSIWLT